MKISINCDMGEAFGRWKLGPDEELMPLIDYGKSTTYSSQVLKLLCLFSERRMRVPCW